MMKKMFSGAPFDVSISKNKRLQGLFTGMIGVARLFFVLELIHVFSGSVNAN